MTLVKDMGRCPALAAIDVRKRYGHVEALRGVTVRVHRGEVLALVGDNGAGKSTLMKVLCGAVVPDVGAVEYGGERFETGSIHEAAAHGVGVVYQDLALAPDLSVLANIYLGHTVLRCGVLGRLGFLDRPAMRAGAQDALGALGAALPSVDVAVNELSGGQRQATAIARAVKWATTAVLLDEPTAALGVRQTERVCELIRTIAGRGLGVLLISHDMPRVLEVADRIAVLRHGQVAAELDAGDTSIADVVASMLGAAQPEAVR